MARQKPSSTTQDDVREPFTAIPHSVLQQASAAAEPTETSTTRALSLQETDLLTPTVGEADEAPPAYGNNYGEIGNEKSGLGTSATVGDDGRVNIRINQLNRRLSQTFNPALRNYAKGLQEARTLPPPYIPPSLGGDEKLSPPPSLNIVIQVVGSRGDVQPFVALGKVLKQTYGHRVRLATHPNFKDFVERNSLEFFSIGGDPSQLMAFMVKNPGLMPGFRSVLSGDVRQRRKDVAEYIQGCWRSCYLAGNGISQSPPSDDADPNVFVADCIIANPPSFAHIHCAEKLGIPLHIMFTMPYSPTQAFPHPLANIQSSNADPQLTNYMSYAMIQILEWQGLGDIINRFRTKCLDLEEVSRIWAPGMLERLKVPYTYCWSPSLIPKPTDWGAHISISGFYLLDLASEYTPTSELQAFLDAGPPPVYVGFGSIVLDDPDAMTELIFEAVRQTGQRVLLSKGWGGMGAGEGRLRIPDGVFMLGNVPHDWLFKRVSCVVHHGGAGTTAAGITAGRPTLIVPFFGDQPFWGAMIARAGAGPAPIPHKELTAERLADGIDFCLRPDSLDRARELANKIATEQGSHKGAQFFHQNLQPDRLRCTIVPSRVAVWRLKHTQVKLSTFAACTLANAQLLDFSDLSLFRAQEYDTDEGPWDPISGFAAALFGTFGNLVGGLGDFPAETYRAARTPFRQRRAASQASSSTSHVRMQDGASQSASMGSSAHEPLNHVRTASNHTATSSLTLHPGPTTMEHTTSVQPDARPSKSDRNLVHTSAESGRSENNDMMRHTAHVSRGFGRMVKTALASPVELSVGITKGFHNTPKIWGDDTVRPQQQVKDMKSGFQAIGKEFGYGMYDGVTGVVTQPWKGAQKGTSGFFKGIGKGIGGLVAKPGAALWAIPAYFMKGVYKEVENLFGTNVQSYIIASRTAQGYEEWLKSDDADKQAVIGRWKLIQKYLKKKDYPEDVLRDILEVHQKTNGEMETTSLHLIQTASSGTSTVTSAPPIIGPENGSLDATDHRTEEEALRQAMASSEIEAQRDATEAAKFDRQLRLVMAQSLRDQGHNGGAFSDANSSPDPFHVAGVTQQEFEAQQSREKTSEERNEEEIVLAYVKKQSLLEAAHVEGKGKGKGPEAGRGSD